MRIRLNRNRLINGSVQFIGGKPGGGKTALAVSILLRELRTSKRVIVTNVALNIGEIAAYFDREGWSYQAEWLADRIIILSEEQLVEFYRYRKPGEKLPMVAGVKAGQQQADYSTVRDCGVLYVLDEVHIAFNSRRWQDTGPAVIYYLSQHRKLGDDVILISQSIQNVDKQMRSMAQDFTYVRNLSKEQHGLFRLPAMFIRRVFLELPTGPNVKPIQTGTFKLDLNGVAKCYNTAAGVGIVGQSGADTKDKPKGLHWAWYVGALVGAIFAVTHYAPLWVEWVVTGGRKAAVKTVTSPAYASTQQVEKSKQEFPVEASPSAGALSSTNIVTGIARFGGCYHVSFSDGSTATALEIIAFGHRKLQINGITYSSAPGL